MLTRRLLPLVVVGTLACDADFTLRADVHVSVAGAPVAGAHVVPLEEARYRWGGGTSRTGADGRLSMTLVGFNRNPASSPFAVVGRDRPMRVVFPGRDYVPTGEGGCRTRHTTLASIDVDLEKQGDPHVPMRCTATTCELIFKAPALASCEAWLVEVAPDGQEASSAPVSAGLPGDAGGTQSKLDLPLPATLHAGWALSAIAACGSVLADGGARVVVIGDREADR
jgi:hypothetical protein